MIDEVFDIWAFHKFVVDAWSGTWSSKPVATAVLVGAHNLVSASMDCVDVRVKRRIFSLNEVLQKLPRALEGELLPIKWKSMPSLPVCGLGGHGLATCPSL